MLRNQQRFEEVLPADFDGVFTWDVLQYFLLRGITPMDFDAALSPSGDDPKARDFDGAVQCPRPPSLAQMRYDLGPKQNQTHIMTFETKPEGAAIQQGQWDTLRVAAWSGLFTVVAMWRKDFAGAFEWQWMHRDNQGAIHTSQKRYTEPYIFLHFFAVWAAAADAYYTQDALFRVLLEWDNCQSIKQDALIFIKRMREIYRDGAKRCAFLEELRDAMRRHRSEYETSGGQRDRKTAEIQSAANP